MFQITGQNKYQNNIIHFIFGFQSYFEYDYYYPCFCGQKKHDLSSISNEDNKRKKVRERTAYIYRLVKMTQIFLTNE